MKRYGAVVRGANAYVPPGARRQTSSTNVVNNDSSAATQKAAEKESQNKANNIPVPKVSLNAPDGSEKPVPRTSPSPASGGTTKVLRTVYI